MLPMLLLVLRRLASFSLPFELCLATVSLTSALSTELLPCRIPSVRSAPTPPAVSAEIIGAMILAGTLAREAKLTYASSFVYFPLCVHAVDIVVSSLGILSLGDGDPRNVWGLSGQALAELTSLDPMRIMQRGYYVAISAAGVIFALLTRFMLYEPTAPSAWLHFFGCGAVGMLTSVVFLKSTQYYTDYQYEPVRTIAAASTTGHGTNIISGVAVGMKSTAVPVVMVSIAVRYLVVLHGIATTAAVVCEMLPAAAALVCCAAQCCISICPSIHLSLCLPLRFCR